MTEKYDDRINILKIKINLFTLIRLCILIRIKLTIISKSWIIIVLLWKLKIIIKLILVRIRLKLRLKLNLILADCSQIFFQWILLRILLKNLLWCKFRILLWLIGLGCYHIIKSQHFLWNIFKLRLSSNIFKISINCLFFWSF